MDIEALNTQSLDEPVSAKPCILIVDDSRTSLLKLKVVLRNMGYDTTSAENGDDALKLLARQKFDLVLLDIVMPGLSGFDVLRAIKADPAIAPVPVVVISATNDDGPSVAQAIELGADDFLPKDFDLRILKARVNASIERKRLRDLEIEYLKQVARLSKAAAVLEAGDYNPRNLDLTDIVERQDGLGTERSPVAMGGDRLRHAVLRHAHTLARRKASGGRGYRITRRLSRAKLLKRRKCGREPALTHINRKPPMHR